MNKYHKNGCVIAIDVPHRTLNADIFENMFGKIPEPFIQDGVTFHVYIEDDKLLTYAICSVDKVKYPELIREYENSFKSMEDVYLPLTRFINSLLGLNMTYSGEIRIYYTSYRKYTTSDHTPGDDTND